MKFLLFGTGDYYERYKKWFDKEDVVALLDNSPQKQNTIIDDIKVLSPEEGTQLSFDVIVVLSFYVKAMRRQLLELGVPENKIYHFYDLNRLIYTKEIKKPIQYYGDAEKIMMSENPSEKRILLLSQDMTLGGPAIALFHVAEILVKHGYKVVYASMIDGPLREKLLAANIPVIVDVNLQIETMKNAEWINNFSLIFCSTINFHVFLSDRNVDVPTLWWLHDSAFFYDGIDRSVLQGLDRTNLQLVSVGPVPKNAIQKFIPDISVERLLYGVTDTVGDREKPHGKEDRVCFVTIGYIEERKGQDVLVQAIQALPDEIRKKAVFYLVGQNSSIMAQQLKAEIEHMPEIVMTGTVNRDEIDEILNSADVLICPSREDPMPTVAAEAMMHSVSCIMSDAAGTAAYIQNGIDGFVFHNEDTKGLCEQIEWCIKHQEELREIGVRSREIYDKYFSMKVFEKELINTVDSMLVSDLSQMLQKYKNSKIAIYGLSTETEKVLAEIDQEFEIVGLLDGYREDGVLYGKRIISLAEALESQVKLILVVARPGSCKAIAKRIGKICLENQIDLIDVRGKDLCDLKKVTYDFKGVQGITKSQLGQLISENDIVSIDLFDTLVMRQTLFPSDVFEMVDCRLREQKIFIENFCGKRLESEKYLAKSTAPTLTEIYTYMLNTYSVSGVTAGELAELEWSVDYELVIPRQEMCELIAEIHNQGKDVYIVSDTYYTRKQLVKLLEKCNITFYTDIFASCEYKTSKTQHLFEKLLEKNCGKSCIHIGDDSVADVESAKKNGIAACKIYSGMELLEAVGYLGLWDSMEGLANKIKIGMFVSKLFNSPFQFETAERKISVKSAYDIGYLFFAPMITDFVIWFAEQVKCNHLQNIWFCARDGYLIQKMYDELKKDTSSVYFLTSRIAAIRAGMENEEDIKYVEEMKFSGTLQEQLEERFGISVASSGGSEEPKAGLSEYSQEILERASISKKNYKSYMEQLKIKDGDIAFFDFVAKGTSQMFIQRLVENHLKGLYFLQLEEEHMRDKELDIVSFYKSEEKDKSAIFDNYYILETVLTAPTPSVKEFDKDGQPVFADETRKDEDIKCFQAVQNGIYDYFKTYLGICRNRETGIDKKLDELFLALIHNVSILDKDFLDLTVEDPFFHRMTDITDLV